MGFREIKINNEYRTTSVNIIKDFYLPVLEETVCYQRAVGFFSSSSLIQLLDGIEHLVKKNGRIQMIVSPKLSEEDIDAIRKGYADRSQIIEDTIVSEFETFINQNNKKSVVFLSKLIELKILDIKVAFLEKNNKIGMFHEKLGIMYDESGDFIAFSGSLNESLTAYSYNAECIDVFRSWLEIDFSRANSKRLAFERMWNNSESGIDIIEFPKIIIDKLNVVKKEYESEFGQVDVNEITSNEITLNTKDCPLIPKDLDIRDYQQSAVDNWRFNNYIGIFDMATGTGKTITALLALENLFRNKGKLAVVIVAPYTHLVEQWVKDLKWFNINPIIGYSDSKYSDYKTKLRNEIMDYNFGLSKFFCFITTNASFRTDTVTKFIEGLSAESLIIIDEAHNFGSNRLIVKLPSHFNYRLALSATLDRHNDPQGTELLYEYFGGKCIEYSLEKAIKEKKLAPYNYYPTIVTLTEDELAEYSKLTMEIIKHMKEVQGKIVLDEIGKFILLKRSRLVASAKNKTESLLGEIEKYKTSDGILIYCGATNMLDDNVDTEEIRQIDLISKKVYKNFGMITSQFTSNEDRETREKIITMFVKNKIQGIIAIKCLDEGVNIPSIKTAFILASSTNPKEHIQRRGRVLRLSKNKEFAEIYDFIVLPRDMHEALSLTEEEKKIDYGLIKRELKRVNEFSRLSSNSSIGFKLIQDLLVAYPQIKWTDFNSFIQTEEME